MGLHYPSDRLKRLISYLELLTKWNRVYNLTAITDPVEMLYLHLMDSLSVEPYILKNKHVIDVGAGAGLPGIPLAMVRDDLQVTELEKNSKKTRFMQQVKLELSVSNLDIHCGRVQDLKALEVKGDIIVARAFAALPAMLDLVEPISRCCESIFAMKGKLDQHELDDIPSAFRIEAVYPITLAERSVERHIIHIRPT